MKSKFLIQKREIKMKKPIKIIVGNTYHIYGKMGTMKKFAPISDGDFCINLIYADMFSINCPDDIEKFNRELENLNTQGIFEARKVN